MGIQFSSLVKGEDIALEQLFDKAVAVDAYNWIYQFLSIIRQPDGEPLKDSRGDITSHLSGLYYRNLKLLETGLRLVYVFDGKPPEFKIVTSERRDVRAEAAKEWKEALQRGDIEEARKAAMRSTTITPDIVEGSKKLLDAMGIPWIQAPSEGEALCARMAAAGDVYCVATQDYDSLPFGAPRLVRNLSITGKRKRGNSYVTINPEMLVLDKVLKNLGISHDQLIFLGILVGTDFNPGGVAGYGPKKALDLVKKHKNVEEIMRNVPWDFDTPAQQIFEFFKNPPTTDYKIRFVGPDEEKIKAFLCDGHDFSEERVLNALNKIKEKTDQKSLNRWVK